MKLLKYLRDLRAVCKPLWFYILLLTLLILALICTPMGRDIMFCIIEDSFVQAPVPLIALLTAAVLWGFCLSFIIMVLLFLSDLSDKDLPPENKRKRLFFFYNMPQLGLYLPIFIINFAFLVAYVSKHATEYSGFIYLVLGFKGIMLFIAYLIARFRQIILNTKYINVVSIFCLLYFGILYILLWSFGFLYDNRSFFVLLFLVSYILIAALRYFYSTVLIKKLDTNVKRLKKLNNIDELEPILTNVYSKEAAKDFYTRFRKMIIWPFYAIVGVSLSIIIGINFLPIRFFNLVGSASLIVLAFACWSNIFSFISAMSKLLSSFFSIGIKTAIIGLIAYSSTFNKDHVIRFINNNDQACHHELTKRKTLLKQFETWFELKYPSREDGRRYPVIFIAAEGGAFRSGAYSAYMLTVLDRMIPKLSEKTFCYSTVSGGTFGCNLYNSLFRQGYRGIEIERLLDSFFQLDYFAPMSAKMVNGEIAGYHSKWYVEHFDRVVTLERSWEEGLDRVIPAKGVFANDFRCLNHNPADPLMLINTTELNTGRRYIIGNIHIDPEIYTGAGDLLALIGKKDKHLSLSTAVGLSSRFPLISPAGTFFLNDSMRYQFVDGGYYENKGAFTLGETLKEIMDNSKYRHLIYPVVIQIAFGEPNQPNGKQGVIAMNEFMEIIAGIYNVRGGHANYASTRLEKSVNLYGGRFFEFNTTGVSENLIPMNWILSQDALKNIKITCQSKQNEKTLIDLKTSIYQIIKP